MALNAAKALLKQGKTALLICDLQERFATSIFQFDSIISNSAKLIKALKLLDVPMLVTEQYPKALGKTVTELDISQAKGPYPKTQFSMYTPEVRNEMSTICCGSPPESIVLIGIEAHVCIENTAIDLKENGYEVHVIADCCSSRSQEDRLFALQRLQQIGCFIATSENVIFKLIADANHPKFKEIQSFIKVPSLLTGLAHLSKI